MARIVSRTYKSSGSQFILKIMRAAQNDIDTNRQTFLLIDDLPRMKLGSAVRLYQW